MRLINWFLHALDMYFPRFITEDVALVLDADGDYEVVCCMDDLEPGERYDAVVQMSAFNFFSIAIFSRQTGDIRPWPNDLTV